MRTLHLRFGLFACAIVVLANGSLAAEPKSSPKFDGTALPEPPHQHDAWTAPATKLPVNLVSAVELLFQQGMADPRGCEYHEIEVVVGDVWNGDDGIQKVHGWVLPRNVASTQRFAVCWNGLVYPTNSVGGAANLKEDIDAMISNDVLARQEWAKHYPNREFEKSFGVIPERSAISEAEICQTKVCMLLRLGESTLAEAYWKQFNGPPNSAPTKLSRRRQRQPDDDPYLSLASEWAWMAFDRAVCAHMRGDDIVARDTAALLLKAQAKIEIAAENRRFKRPTRFDPKDMNRELSGAPYISFLGPLPSLVSDEQRRVKEGKIDRVLDHPAEYKDKRKRILALIRDLEQDSARQWGQPGGVDLEEDPIPQALEKEGTDAVGPLLDCLATDTRLTRAVRFGRDFGDHRELLTVANAAYVTLCHIMQVDQFGPLTHYGWEEVDKANRAATVTEIREFCEKHKGISPAEQWYRILADDNAQPAQWLEAAERIVQPPIPGARGGRTMAAPGEVHPFEGESLRSKANPSVARLLAKRVPQIAGAEQHNSNDMFAAADATRVALVLAEWDSKAAIPVMRAQLKVMKRVYAQWSPSSQDDMLVAAQADLFSTIQNAGDSTINHDYAVWIRGLGVPENPTSTRVFQPLWQQPHDPDIAAAAGWLFNDSASPWHCLAKSKALFGQAGELIATPLISVAAFKKNVLANLADKSSLGEIWLNDGRMETIIGGYHEMQDFFLEEDPLLPKPGEKRTVRVCDWYALRLARLEGSPEFEAFWPQEKRDAAIQADLAFVRDWSDRFAWNSLQQVPVDLFFVPARMIFPRRDRPATDADVRAHTAIFSLAGSGQVRAVALDPFPTEAKWTTLKHPLVLFQSYDPKKKRQATMSEPDQRGWIWQAEERMENGRWKRYYGFVGRHIVAKVPAEEIELVHPDRPAANAEP